MHTLGEVAPSGGYRSRDANVLPMSDWVDTEMQKHHTAIQSLASTHGPSAGPVYVTGVLIGLNYSTQQTSDLNELSSRLKALLDSSKQG